MLASNVIHNLMDCITLRHMHGIGLSVQTMAMHVSPLSKDAIHAKWLPNKNQATIHLISPYVITFQLPIDAHIWPVSS